MRIAVRQEPGCHNSHLRGLTMPNLVFRFPAGHYHATPWGHHVNEGLVEWPPSPWRIVRALLSTGFSKLGWREPPAAARELVEGMASVLPTFRLPPAIASHTRHFMPTDSKKPEERTKIFDAFAHVGKHGELAVLWPAPLSANAEALLKELVPKLSYLGRAESVVEARLAADADLPEGTLASAVGVNRPGVEPIALLAPITASAYAAWLAEARPRDDASPGNKAKRVKASPFPSDAFSALLVDTSFLQEHGWTQPPGSQRVIYYRPPLSTSPVRSASHPRAVAEADTALFALASDTRRGDVLPLLSRAVPQAELLHMGLASHLGTLDCPELTGRDSSGKPLEGHRHVTIVPLDLGRSGHIDHFLLHAPMGLGPSAQHALRLIRKTYAKGAVKPLFVTLVGVGALREFVRLDGEPVPDLAESRVWTSKTPFVPPRHLKQRRHTLQDQLMAELATRGLPPASGIDVLSRDEIVARGFHRFVRARRDPRRGPPASCFFGLRIELARPVRGPIALGYGSHFGLGLFIPAHEP
jgi:CRISPR-associated protein Csb2